MVLNFVFLFLFFLLISAIVIFLYCMFLPSLKSKYDELGSFMINGDKLEQDDIRIVWKTKHLPWAPELTIVSKKNGPQIEEDQDNKHSIVSKIIKVYKKDK